MAALAAPAAELWNTAVRSAPDSLMHQALATTTQLAAANTTLTPAWQPWTGQLAAAMAAVGQPLDLTNPTTIPLAALATASSGSSSSSRPRRPGREPPDTRSTKGTSAAAPSPPNSLASGNLTLTSSSGASGRRWRRCGPAHTGARRRKAV